MCKKFEFLGQEVFRRLHNTKLEIHNVEIIGIMNKFMTELKMSGYSHHDRYEILKSGYNHYNKLRLKEASGVRPFYRKSNFQKLKRKQKKCVKKLNWYKNGNGNKFSSVFFVPSTPGSR